MTAPASARIYAAEHWDALPWSTRRLKRHCRKPARLAAKRSLQRGDEQ